MSTPSRNIVRTLLPLRVRLTSTLPADFTEADITRVLGFAPETDTKAARPWMRWEFMVLDQPCMIWGYLDGDGQRWSAFDPCRILPGLFGMKGGAS